MMATVSPATFFGSPERASLPTIERQQRVLDLDPVVSALVAERYLGGRLTFSSEAGVGRSFVLELPPASC
jgi:hypothetical protein